jgi:Domain of unknown function (DUF5617)
MTIPKKDLHNTFPELGNTKLKLVADHLIKKHSLESTSWQNFFRKETASSSFKEIANKTFFTSDSAATNTTAEASESDLASFLSVIKPLREKNKLKLFTLSTPKEATKQKVESEETEFAQTVFFDESTFYTENMPDHHFTRLHHHDKWKGWVDFFITSDNEIILAPTSDLVRSFFKQGTSSVDLEHYLNLYTLSWGTLVKTAGKFRIETDSQGNNRLIFAAESDYWEVDRDKMMPIVLQVLHQKGFHLSRENIFFLNKKEGIPLNIEESVPKKFLTPVTRYLAIGSTYNEVNEERYPLATHIAKKTDPVVAAKLATLFIAIDDAVFSAKNKLAIQQLVVSPFLSVESRLDLLKRNIAKFLVSLTLEETEFESLSEEHAEQTLFSVMPGTESQPPITGRKPIQWLEKVFYDIRMIQNDYDINLNFVSEEALSLQLYYEDVKRQYKEATEEENLEKQEQLSAQINNIHHIFRHFAENVACYSRHDASSSVSVSDAPTARFLEFYEQDPFQTCINLLRDYTKNGSRFMRILTGAWRRHYVTEVQQFLNDYDRGYVVRDGSIDSICRRIFLDQSLFELEGKTGTCITRLRFCATLNGEMPNPLTPKKLFGLEKIEDGEVAEQEKLRISDDLEEQEQSKLIDQNLSEAARSSTTKNSAETNEPGLSHFEELQKTSRSASIISEKSEQFSSAQDLHTGVHSSDLEVDSEAHVKKEALTTSLPSNTELTESTHCVTSSLSSSPIMNKREVSLESEVSKEDMSNKESVLPWTHSSTDLENVQPTQPEGEEKADVQLPSSTVVTQVTDLDAEDAKSAVDKNQEVEEISRSSNPPKKSPMAFFSSDSMKIDNPSSSPSNSVPTEESPEETPRPAFK